MTKEEKVQLVDDLSKKFSEKSFFYIADASGLNVAQANQLRGLCYEKGIEYKVVKNTLIEKAFEKAQIDAEPFKQNGALDGFSGIFFADEAANEPAKIIKDFRKKTQFTKPAIKAAYIDTELYFGDESLDTLAKMKSKNELIGDVIGLLQSPAQNVISSLQSGGDKLAGIMKTLSEKEE